MFKSAQTAFVDAARRTVDVTQAGRSFEVGAMRADLARPTYLDAVGRVDRIVGSSRRRLRGGNPSDAG